MNRIILTLAAGLMATGHAYAADLATYKATYEKEMEAIVLAHGMQMTTLGQQYTKALDELLTKVKSAGDLNKTTAVMDEIKRFTDEKKMPEKPAALLDIQNLQAYFAKQASAYDVPKAEKIVTLTAKYDQALERLQKSLVATDKLDDAKAVQAEREAVAKSEAAVAAKTAITAAATTSTHKPIEVAPQHPKEAKAFGSHWYAAYHEQLSWHDAKKRCEAMGGYLACIGSRQENSFLGELGQGRPMWIGGTDEKKEGEWAWIDGGAFRFTKWFEGQPDNHKGLEHYLFIGLAHRDKPEDWNDSAADDKNVIGFICEWN